MTELNLAEFYSTAIQGSSPTLITFTAPGCSYCRHLMPALTRMSRDYPHIVFGAVDIDREPQLAHQEQIEVVPTLVLYRSGRTLGSIVVPESSAQVETFLRESLDL